MMPQKVVGLEPCCEDEAPDLPAEAREPQQKDWNKLPKDRGQRVVI